jgi:murein DD-endopeptidase MepM/ murein hydrolase activator NlpD
MRSLKEQISKAKGEAAGLQREVERLSSQIRSLNDSIRGQSRRVATTESDIRSAQAEIAKLEQRMGDLRTSANERARRLYMRGPEVLAPIMFARTADELSRAIRLMEVTADQQAQSIVLAARVRAELGDKRESLIGLKTRLKAEQDALEERRGVADDAKKFRDGALADVRGRIASEEAELKRLEDQSRRLTAILSSRLSRSTGSISRAGFGWPLRGRLTSAFGRRWGTFHYGIDIDGSTGDPIGAAKDGTIVPIACGSGYGICSIVDHGNGVTTLYAHMVRKAMMAGPVKRGDVIGFVGSTGHSTGSHLHFEVRVDGAPRNPRQFLS